MRNLKNEFAKVKSTKVLNDLIKASKSSAKGIFAMHRNVLDMYILDNKDYFTKFNFVDDKGRLNPSIKELRNKGFKPFQLLYGTFSLDKVLKASETKDFLSFMGLYNTSVLTYMEANSEEQQTILERGTAINSLFTKFKNGEIGGIEFIKELFEFFPSFYENLKNGKIAVNVAKFIFNNDSDLYNLLNIKNICDVELDEIRKDIKKTSGTNGLILFDELLSQSNTVEQALKLFNNGSTVRIEKEKV